MALAWLTVLKSVPWSEVLSTAPVVAEGAKRLWDAVGRKAGPAVEPGAAAPPGPPVRSAEAQALAALEARAAALETAVADLQAQMLDSSALIKALAEQNAQLIARLERARVRSMWLTAAVVVVALLALATLAMVLGRPAG